MADPRVTMERWHPAWTSHMWEMFRRAHRRAGAPVDGASLGVVRIAFGALLAILEGYILGSGYIQSYWVDPAFHFRYLGFGWVPFGSSIVLHTVVGVTAVAALAVALGLWYRLACTVLLLGFGYQFLLEQTLYLNHHYLIVLLCGILLVVPAANEWSLDSVRRRRGQATRVVGSWAVWLLRFQVGIVYVYAAIAKINLDWLTGEPMSTWTNRGADNPLIGVLMSLGWQGLFFTYGGLLLDALVVPALLYKRTRPYAFACATLFHVMNAYFFNISVFPWLMIAVTTIFFEPDWPRLVRGVARLPRENDAAHCRLTSARTRLITIYCAAQLLIPLRHWLYPGDVAWTEEGHMFSWRMLLRSKEGSARFFVSTPDSTFHIDPRDYLPEWQRHKVVARPNTAIQFAHQLAGSLRGSGVDVVAVRAQVLTSLNGHPPSLLLDPCANLLGIEPGVGHATWIRSRVSAGDAQSGGHAISDCVAKASFP